MAGRRGGTFAAAGRGVTVCRWIAYSGTPVLLSEVLFQLWMHNGMISEFTKVDALRALHPDVSFPRELSDETRLVVSEPLGDLPGAWNEVPESSYGVVQPGGGVLHRFRPEYTAGSGARG
ncbi:hypothetical protein AUW26_26580 [Streptomyces sp. CC71]|nr:hypothetical protein AUW26_26580 [Streptomyces sp. CC71]GGZ90005.1 hypothetical protein GCM10010301_72480 [Streptomyces plicatus]